MDNLSRIESALRDLRSSVDGLRTEHRRLIYALAAPLGSHRVSQLKGLLDAAITIVGGSRFVRPVGRLRAGWPHGHCGILLFRRVGRDSGLIITAAHCGPSGGSSLPTTVALPVTNVADLAGAQIINGVFDEYPGYLRGGTHDIAVITLSGNSTVAPVALAATAEIQQATEVTLAGFGDTDVNGTTGWGVKRFVTVPIDFLQGGVSDQPGNSVANLDFDKSLEFVVGAASTGACFGQQRRTRLHYGRRSPQSGGDRVAVTANSVAGL